MTGGTALDPIDEAGDVPIRDAATVALVRDTAEGIEVSMLRRSARASFVGGMYVFPGGAVDRSDAGSELEACAPGLTDAAASERLGLTRGGLAYWVAAIRECFEESGVLLANGPDGLPVRLDRPEQAERFGEHRLAVHAGKRSMRELCEMEQLTLGVAEIRYLAHWITPVGPPRRFDTRFFAARAPSAQVASEDTTETVAHLWVRPADALQRHEDGELEMILPTLHTLTDLGRFDRVHDLFADLDRRTAFPAMLPKIRHRADGPPEVLLPGDAGYDEAPGNGQESADASPASSATSLTPKA